MSLICVVLSLVSLCVAWLVLVMQSKIAQKHFLLYLLSTTIFFGGDCDNHVVEIVTAKLGYDDAEEIMRIESALLEKLDAKN